MNNLEQEKERKAGLVEAQRDLDIFKDMEDNVVWTRVREIAQAQIAWRTQSLMKPEVALQKEDTSSDYCKGMIEGIRLMVAIPSIAVQQAQEMLEKEREREDTVDENEA